MKIGGLVSYAYRLVSCWLPIPFGGIAYLLFRRRHPDRASRRDEIPGDHRGERLLLADSAQRMG